MTPEEFVVGLQDAIALVAACATANPAAGLKPALDLLEKLLIALPPIDARDLDPADRAAADKEAADLLAAKFGK